MRIKLLAGALVVAGMASIGAAQPAGDQSKAPADDPYTWLEEIQGERALAWARQENTRTLGELQADPRYQRSYDRALEILQARDRIPTVEMRADGLYNFWQDADHVRGIVRRTNLQSYRTENPQWETVLDIDALAAAENKSWVYQGMSCLPPDDRRCLVFLSDGGRDANVVREFDLVERRFVDGGFSLPDGKQFVTWQDRDTILVAREWGPGTMTASGYPFVIKRLRRGQPLEQAQEIFRGEAGDVLVAPSVLRDSDGQVHGVGAYRGLDFFHRQFVLLREGGNLVLPLPQRSSVAGIVDGRLLVTLDEAWAPSEGLSFAPDSVVSYDLAEWKRDPMHARPSLVWAPGPRQTLNGLSTTHGRLLLTILDNVRGRAFAYDFVDGAWRSTEVALPPNSTISVAAASDHSEQAMFSVTSFLSPTTLVVLRRGRRRARDDQDDAAAVRRVEHRRRAVRGDVARRHPHPLFPDAAAQHADGRDARRPCSTAMAASSPRRCRPIRGLAARSGSSRAMPMSSPICAAAASSAPNGTRPRRAPTSSAPGTISSPSPRI